MSVVGFDIGNLNCYISVARAGGIEVATNDYSLHATPAVVQFGTKGRVMGVPAKNSLMSNIRNSVYNFKNLIGRRWGDPVVEEERRWLPFEAVETAGGGLGFRLEVAGETKVLSPEQVLAVLLLKLKESAEAFLKTKVWDCVITVPGFWSEAQRRALLDAASIAGLHCLRILNETTAVALAYGIYKQDLPAETERARQIAFVDVGHSATQAAVVAFYKGKLKVLGYAFDATFGGRALDRRLRDHFTAEFKQKFGVDAATRPKAYQRLLDECEKLKKLMSANSQALPLAIECFMDDKDVKGQIARAEFEELASDLWPRLPALLQRLMASAKLKTADLDGVEIVGGSSRIPRVKSLIADFFGAEPRTTLNQDEAVSRGAALQCAMLSPTFRVREFAVQDVQPYAVKVAWTGSGEADPGEMIVFDEGETFPFSKIISFYRKEAFTLTATYAHPNAIPYPSAAIGSFKISKVTPDAEGGSSKVKVKVRLNPNGLFLVSSASMLEKKTGETEAVEEMAEETNGVDEAKAKADETVPATPPAADAPMETGDAEAAAAKEEKKEEVKAKPTKPKVKSVELTVEESVGGLSASALEAARALESSMQAADRREREKADARNTLESYVYEMREKVSDGGSLDSYASPGDKEAFVAKLNQTEEWIYDEGEDVEKSVYEDRLGELKIIGDPIGERAAEAQLRPAAWTSLRSAVVKARKFLDSWAAGEEKFAHIDAADVEKVRKILSEKETWADKNEGAQNARDKTLPPLVFAAQIRQESEALERVANPIMNKPKPKVEPPPESAAKDAPATEAEAAANAEASPSENPPLAPNAPEMEVD